MLDSCEQGQKAIAWEMTRKAVGADFFDGKTTAQLQACGDFNLEFQGLLIIPLLYETPTEQFHAVDWAEAYVVALRTRHSVLEGNSVSVRFNLHVRHTTTQKSTTPI